MDGDGEELAFDEAAAVEALKKAARELPKDARKSPLLERALALGRNGNDAGIGLVVAWAAMDVAAWKAAGGRGEPSFESLEAAIAMHEVV